MIFERSDAPFGPDDAADDSVARRELARLADELIEQAVDIRRQWSALAEALAPDAADPLPAVDVPARSLPETVRLVALDMLLSGRSRDEVEEHLRHTFGTEDTADVLDDVCAQFDD